MPELSHSSAFELSTRSHGMVFYWVLGLSLLLIYGAIPTNGRCERGLVLPHGSIVFRNRNVVRFRCNRGYTLLGKQIETCDRDGRLRGERPFCAKSGCPEQDSQVTGLVVNLGPKSVIVCHDGYVLVGNRAVYCDGEHWNTPLGTCLRSNHTQDHSCDFESEDQCGWETETTFRRPWKRVSTMAEFHSQRTGPQHDHTFRNHSGGHYMRMETQSGAFGSYHLISPIYPRELSLKTACCFRFHYFMYGDGVDSLVVSVKPASMPVGNMWNRFRANFSKFEMSGSQGTKWLEHTITIDEMQEDFQVIFTATDARARFGDIAIDDVKLMTGKDCGVGEFTTTTELTDATEPELVFSMMNCTGRCGQSMRPEEVFVFSKSRLTLGCACDDDCTILDNCCLDYVEECVKGIYTSVSDDDVTLPMYVPSRDYGVTSTTAATTTPTSTPIVRTTKLTTTTTTTSTTPRPTTTTTTKKPVITTTTRKMPVSTTTTTTTTTRKMPVSKTTTTTKMPVSTTTTTRKMPVSTTTTTRKIQVSTTTPSTTTRRTTTPKQVITTTTSTPTKGNNKTPTSTLVSSKHTKVSTAELTNKRITWKVDPEDIAGHMPIHGSSPNPALVVLYLLIAVVLVVVLGNVTHRWIIPLALDGNRRHEKAVSFKRAIADLRKPGRFSRNRRNSLNQPLCETDNEDGDYFETDGMRIEEMGVDIRNVSDL